MNTKILSIYLPQFHTIPENDEWWGKGFTEWTNVKRGKAYYPGHYQPREPLHDNYYDLSDLKVLEKHTRLAKKAGIEGFCFYHYYFRGRKLLEKPIENYRDYSKENFPYCLVWANQSWARTWYRADNGKQMLLEQSYGKEKEWEEHFYYLLSFFKDERYIKVNNKPVYIIYLPQDIYCKRSMYKVWDKLAKENGFSGIYLIAMNTAMGKDKSSRLYDGYLEFEPLSTYFYDRSWRTILKEWKNSNIGKIESAKSCLKNILYMKNQYSYDYICKQIVVKAKKSDDKTFAGVFTGWDNTARKDEEGFVITRSTPVKFGKLVRDVLSISESKGKEFVFLNAWNEWSEGAYIEPDKKYRHGYLAALKKAIQRHDERISKNEKSID